MNPLTSFLVFAFVVAACAVGYFVNPYAGVVLFACAVLIASSLKMANVWQKFVILRLGKLQSFRGAGLFALIPVLDTVIAVIDERIQTTAFNAESALTKDTVPLKLAHPDWVVPASWWPQGLWNLEAPGLREYKVAVLRELATRYDFDGI